MTPDDNAALVRRFLAEAWNKGNVAIADELLAADYIYHNTGLPPGPEGAGIAITKFHQAFSAVASTFDDIIATGDKVVVRWTTHATHSGEFLGATATGRRVEYSGIDIFRLAAGKIAERWGVSDNLSVMEQLGMLDD